MNANRHSVCAGTKWHAHGRMAGEIGGDCVDIAQIHRHRIFCFFAEWERNNWRGWRENHIHVVVGAFEIFSDEATHFEGLAVIRVVITSRQGVGAKHDATLHFIAKAGGTCCAVHGVGIDCIDTQSVTHTVVACEVAARLSRCNEVIRSECIRQAWQRDIDNGRACCSKCCECFVESGRHFCFGTTRKIHHATDAHASDTLCHRCNKRRCRLWNGCRVHRVVSGDCFSDECSIGNCRCKRTNLIERTCIRNESVPAHESVRGLHADDATHCGGLTNASTCVASETDWCKTCSNGRCTATT